MGKFLAETRQNAEQEGSAKRIAIGQFWSRDWSAFCHFSSSLYKTINNPNADANHNANATPYPNQWLKWFCEAGGSPDEARLEQTSYPFQPH